MAEDIFDSWPVMTWTVGGKTIEIPAQSIKRSYSNRLVGHPRLYRDGRRHDDTGGEPTTWEVTLVAHKDSEEQGIRADFYPNGLFQLEDSAKIHETGDLVTPRGVKRCRFASISTNYDRGAVGVDAAGVSCQWVEDNEDDTDEEAFEAPTAVTSAQAQVDAFEGFANLAGAGGGDFFDAIRQATSDLVALAEFPGEALGQIVSRIELITSSANQIGRAYASAPAGVVDSMGALMTDPFAGPALRKLEELIDTACKTQEEEARRSGANREIKRYKDIVSIFDVSVDVGQPVNELMEMNPLNAKLVDYFAIPVNYPISVTAQ